MRRKVTSALLGVALTATPVLLPMAAKASWCNHITYTTRDDTRSAWWGLRDEQGTGINGFWPMAG